ncbi:hypothetical protein ACF1GW_38530 [Streptomyces achromogenes]|uniref:hypothetical protein n=1 Tax=Streptomyces achromogenes TaxID=67255 RepID=UPI0036F89BDD
MTEPTETDRRERYATAIHDAMETDLSLVDQEPAFQALIARAAEAAMALADAELAVLPAPDQQAAIRAEAFEEAAIFVRDAHFDNGLTVQEITTALGHTADRERRRAGEAQQDPTRDGAEAHPAEHTWAAELYDPVADEWVPGTRYAVRDRAVNHLEHARTIGPTWKDGTPTQRRLVRATTTYTVEDPAAVAGSGQSETDEETLVHVGWWCWRGDNNGHLATMACRSDNVPIHVPAEWAEEMRAVLRRLENDDEDELDSDEEAQQEPTQDAEALKSYLTPSGNVRVDHLLRRSGQPETDLVEQLARGLAGAAAVNPRRTAAPWDDLTAGQQDAYRQQARTILGVTETEEGTA